MIKREIVRAVKIKNLQTGIFQRFILSFW